MSDLAFFKSSHSLERGECVEVAFRTPPRPPGDGARATAAGPPVGAALRDSGHPRRGRLDVPRREWAVFLGTARL
ncbi:MULTISPECIES: DUF397 domain-containing protein [Nocardiopsis]|uniref:DUF397 domain-containing protein n=1 Tax=Nocardiopsis tropica TaxID=109330 RepID=A0ABU7KWI8_9ACTN|nr:DUF397 domain-containing protein [Nocardiopsis umidischolae]MEE2053369.1 DUF397 domain-containing protein [Nocardiopsis umidischolae]